MLACLLLVPVLLSARTYIICVGVADYPGTVNDLRVSAHDAVTVSRIFEKNKHAEGLYYVNSGATRDAVLRGMRKVYAKAGRNDVVMFFFSGHGVPGAFVCYDGLMGYRSVIKEMLQSKASDKIVIADACFAGKMRGSKKHNRSYSRQNVMFFLSSRSSEKSLELPRRSGFSNSLFTAFLERGLRGGADADRNRIITARELYSYVHSGVVSASRGQQHPVMWGKFNSAMPVIKW